jgi:hypothetical protein
MLNYNQGMVVRFVEVLVQKQLLLLAKANGLRLPFPPVKLEELVMNVELPLG